MKFEVRAESRSDLRIGVVTAQFNPEITSRLHEGAIKVLKNAGLPDTNIYEIQVPGAFEIPLAVESLFTYQDVDGVIALGAVIRGETPHFDYVCQAVERGCSEIAIRRVKPVAFGVLTTNTDAQAEDRIGGAHGHKGEEAAQVVLDMIDLVTSMRL